MLSLTIKQKVMNVLLQRQYMKFDLKIIKLNNFRYFKLIVHIISLDFLEVKKKFYRFLLNFHDSPKLLINTMNYYM